VTVSPALQGSPQWRLFVLEKLLWLIDEAAASCPQELAGAMLQVSNNSLVRMCQHASSRPSMLL